MTDTSIQVVVTAICGLISTVVLAWMQKTTKISVDQSNVKLDEAVGKRERIHDLVDGNFSKVTADVKSANERLESMQKIVSKLLEKIDKPNGVAPIPTAPIQVIAAPAVTDEKLAGKAEEILKSIDSNTAAIEKNTAKTDANVQDLKDNIPT